METMTGINVHWIKRGCALAALAFMTSACESTSQPEPALAAHFELTSVNGLELPAELHRQQNGSVMEVARVIRGGLDFTRPDSAVLVLHTYQEPASATTGGRTHHELCSSYRVAYEREGSSVRLDLEIIPAAQGLTQPPIIIHDTLTVDGGRLTGQVQLATAVPRLKDRTVNVQFSTAAATNRCD